MFANLPVTIMTRPLFSKGHVALITGAAMGIGRACALECARRGLSVFAIDLPGEDLDALEQELNTDATDGVRHQCIAADLADPKSIDRVESIVYEHGKTINILMNNAVTRQGRTFEGSTSDWKQLFDVNLWALVETSRRFLPAMLQSGERCAIINVGSKQGITNPPGTPAYNMAKAAVKVFTEQLEHEIRNSELKRGPTTSHLLVPGWTTTGKNSHKPGAWLPQQVVDYLINGVESRHFYIICPDDEVSTEMDKRRILWAAEDITKNRPALSRWEDSFKEEASRSLNSSCT